MADQTIAIREGATEADHQTELMVRLTERIAHTADKLTHLYERLDGSELTGAALAAPPLHRVGWQSEHYTAVLPKGAARPGLPDPRLLRRIIRQRRMRSKFFKGDLFADPAWDILLDLAAARAENKRVSVTSLCIASAVPPTTALRWIAQLVEAGLLQRVEDDVDRRRAFVWLSDVGADAVARYFADLGNNPGSVV